MQDVDPALSRLLSGDGSLERLERWRLWPLLLGLPLWSPAWNSAKFLPAIGATTGNLDAITICAEAFALTLPEVIKASTFSAFAGCFCVSASV